MLEKKIIIAILFFSIFLQLPVFGEKLYSNTNLQNSPTPNNTGRFIEDRLPEESNTEEISVTKESMVSEFQKIDLTEIKFNPNDEFNLTGTLQLKSSQDISQQGFLINSHNVSIPYSRLNYDGKLSPFLKYNIGMQAINLNNDGIDSEILTDAYLYSNIIPHHTVYFGQTRISTNQEETPTLTFLETIDNQIQDSFMSLRNMGVKLGGSWDFIDYSIGAYNTDSTISGNSNSISTGGWTVIKPFYNQPTLGKLELGSGFYTTPDQFENQTTYGLYGGYKFKKFAVKGEYTAKENNHETKDYTEGWLVSNTYYLTNTLSIIAKHNRLNPELGTINNFVLEYSVKENSLLKVDNLKFQLNASQIQNPNQEDRKRVGIQAKFSF